jgi:hypothetical protein
MRTMFGCSSAAVAAASAKAVNLLGTAQAAEKKHFDGDGAVEAALSSAIDDTHAAARNFFEQFVIAESSLSPCCHGGFWQHCRQFQLLLTGSLCFHERHEGHAPAAKALGCMFGHGSTAGGHCSNRVFGEVVICSHPPSKASGDADCKKC